MWAHFHIIEIRSPSHEHISVNNFRFPECGHPEMPFDSLQKMWENLGTNPDLGSGGGDMFSISHCQFFLRIARKLRTIILLHLGLVAFGIRFGRTHGLDPTDVTVTPKTSLIYLWRLMILQVIREQNPQSFSKNRLWELACLCIHNFESFGNDVSRSIYISLEDPSNSFAKILKMGSIVSNKQDWDNFNGRNLNNSNCSISNWMSLNNPTFQSRESPTPQHSDSHPCTGPLLGRHEVTWATVMFLQVSAMKSLRNRSK